MSCPNETPSHLALVQCGILRADSRLQGLSHVADLLTAFLDASSLWPMPRAAASGSVRLFNRVVSRLRMDSTTDPHVFTAWLSHSMKVAIRNNDLTMTQRTHGLHAEPLDVRSLRLALLHGTLEMVQWVVENRHDCLCCPVGLKNLCRGCLRQALRYRDPDEQDDPARLSLRDPLVLPWLVEGGIVLDVQNKTDKELVCSAARQSRDVAAWCTDSELLTREMAQQVLFDLISYGPPASISVLDLLLERGYSISQDRVITAMLFGVRHLEMAALLEAVVSSRLCDALRDKFQYTQYAVGGAKVLQWEAEFMNSYRLTTYRTIPVILSTVSTDYQNLDQIKWVYYERGVRPCFASLPRNLTEPELVEFLEWIYSIGVEPMVIDLLFNVARNGQLELVRWIYANYPRGEQELGYATWNDAIVSAARGGHLHVVRWIQEEGIGYCTSSALEKAAAFGHLEVIRWIYEYSTVLDTITPMALAAHGGHVDVLVWLFANWDANCAACVSRKLIVFYDPFERTPSLSRMALRWLQARLRIVPTPNALIHILERLNLRLHQQSTAVCSYWKNFLCLRTMGQLRLIQSFLSTRPM